MERSNNFVNPPYGKGHGTFSVGEDDLQVQKVVLNIGY
jgi:hypothetical protein